MNQKSLNQTPKFIKPSQKMSVSAYFEDCSLVTPVSIKQNNEKLRRKRIESVTPENLLSFQNLFQTNLEKSWHQFEMNVKAKNIQLIKQFTPKCQSFEKRNEQIYMFFISFCFQIQNSSKSFFKQADQQLLNSIACISFQLFDFTNLSVKSEYKRRCQIFGTNFLSDVKAFQLIKQHALKSMSSSLVDCFNKIVKLYFVSEIWQNSSGYKVICEAQNLLNTQITSIKNAFQKINYECQARIKQICKPARIQNKIISKTINMMKFIFEHKPYLLKNNNLDQIILCSLMSCLSMNEKEGDKSLHVLFQQYNSVIEFSYNENQHGLKDNEGNQMKIVEYYNQVFLNEIQDMINVKFDNLQDFLLTPVRISQKYSMKHPLSSLSNMKQINPEKSFGSIFSNARTIKQRKNSRLQSLFNQSNNQMKEQKQEDEEDAPSPSFNRNFSFGPSSDQK